MKIFSRQTLNTFIVGLCVGVTVILTYLLLSGNLPWLKAAGVGTGAPDVNARYLDGYGTSLSAGASKIYISDGSNYLPDSTVDSGAIVNGTIVSDDIANGTIVSADIAANTIVADDIAADAVGSSEIATGAVGSDEIADGTIVSADIATDTIEAGDIKAGAVGTSEIADGTIVSADIADGTISSTDLADGTSITEIADDDGAGSGLDADFLDGKDAEYYRGGACVVVLHEEDEGGVASVCACPDGYTMISMCGNYTHSAYCRSWNSSCYTSAVHQNGDNSCEVTDERYDNCCRAYCCKIY